MTILTSPLPPDLVVARRFLDAHAPRGRVLYAAISGAHLYGFPSADSDLDLKGAFVAPTADILGLDSPSDTENRTEVLDGVEVDVTLHEASKLLRLLLRGSGNILEQIFSPYQVVDTPELGDLRRLARGSLSARTCAHYAGFFRQKCQEAERAPEPEVKTVLYAWRVGLTGLHLLETGEVEPNLVRLASLYGRDNLLALVEQKRSGAEHDRLSRPAANVQRQALAAFAVEIERAHERSTLPEEPPNRRAASDWLTNLRLRELERGSE